MTSEHAPTSATTSRATRSGLRREGSRQARRSMMLTAASTLAPGSGLLTTTRRTLGRVLLGLFVLLLGAGIAFVVVHSGPLKAAVVLGTSENLLLALAVLTGVAAVVWVLAIVVTHLVTRPRNLPHSHQGLLRVLTAALCLVVLAPSAEVVRYALITRDTLGGVFGGSLVQKPQPTPTPEATPWASTPRVNVFLLGSDAGPDRTGVRTDSMIVASIDTRTGDTVLIGIPRNLERVPIPKDNPLIKIWPHGYDCGDKCLINALWVEAENHKELFVGDPNPGLTTIRGVLDEVLGIHIDYTVIADLAGFRRLVDAMGGVEINVLEDTAIYGAPPNYPITSWIRAGRQVLDGYHALWYSRSRVYSKGSDFDRMKRQRCVVNALIKQANPANLLRRYPDIAGAVKDNVSTDIPSSRLSDWADLVLKVQKATVRSLALTPDNISVVHPDYVAIKKMVADALTTPPPTSKPTSPSTASTSTPISSSPSTGASSGGRTTTKPTSSPSTSVDPATAVDLGAAC